MAKSWRLALGQVALLGIAIAGCDAPEKGDEPAKGDEQTTQKRSALTTSLFQPYVAYPTGSFPEAVAIGDLDGDGRKDIALLTSFYFDAANDYMVHVFLQNADGTLKPRVKYSVGRQGSSMDIGDVNGDGRDDVVVGLSSGAGTGIAVLLQNASGTLNPMVSYTTVNSYSVKVGDFNGDGRMDVAGINFGAHGDGLDVFLQTETGSLASPVTYHVPRGGRDELDAGDIDGDGRTDLVVMSGQVYALPDLNVLLQGPDGTFGAPTSYSLIANGNPAGVAIGDTNGDGRTDIVLSGGGSRPTAFIARLLQDSQGALAPAVLSPSHDNPSALVVADVDGDGRKDALVAHGASQLGVFRQFPNGDFLAEELYAIPSASAYEPQGLAVGDINGDSRPDAVIADYNRGLIVLRHVPETPLALAVTAPAAGGTCYTGVPVTARWATGDTVALASVDVSVGYSGGFGLYTYTPLAGCTGLPPTATECPWTPTSASAFPVRIRVTARNAQGQTAFAETSFTLVNPSISPNVPSAPLLVGTTTTISWLHNLPPSDTVRIELTRDGGATYEQLAAAAPISVPTNTTAGTFSWTVTGPATTTARLRVTPNAFQPVPLGNTSQNFAITTTPTLTVYSPGAGATYYTNSVSASWTSNAGNVGTVSVELSRDGGATFETIVASMPNTGSFSGSVPGPSADDARLRVTLTISGFEPVTAVSNSFKLFHPEVAITSPAAGSTLFVGTPLGITWSSNVPASWSARVELSRNGGNTWEFLTSVPNTGSFNWVVAGAVTSAAQIRVTLTGGGSASATSGTFAIATPSLTVTSPAATVYVGAPAAITWTHNLPASDTVRIEVSRDGGAFATVAAAAPNTGSYTWNVTGPDALAQVRVTSNSFSAATSTGASFPIVTPSLTVTAPVGGAVVFDSWLSIAWTSTVASATSVLVELSRDGGATFQTLAAAAPSGPSGGVFSGSAFGPDTTNAVVRVTTNGPLTTSGTSASFAMLTPSLTVTSPAAGAAIYAGEPVAITWSTNLPASSVSIELSRDGGSTFEILAAAAPNTGSFAWTATGPDSSAVVVRVAASSPASASGNSGTFAIATPSLTVTGPAADAVAYVGTPVTISWTHNLSESEPVTIELSRDGGATFGLLAASAPNTGSFLWTATGPDTAAARVRVATTGALAASHVGAAFQITTATLAVTSPAAGANWAIGTARTISWSSNLAAGTTVRVDLSRDGGTTWTALASASPASGSLAWTATSPATTTARVRVTANGGVPAVGTSGAFTIGNPTLAVTSPTAGLQWTIGAARTITWTTNLLSTATVKIELTRNGGTTYTTLASAAPNSGSFSWTATGPSSTTAKVRVSANGFTASSTSSTFSLVNGSVTVTSPNTAVVWTIGTVHAITWNHNAGAGAQFKIEVSRSGVWTTITSAATAAGATSGSYNWTVVGPRSTNAAKIRVTWNANTAAQDSSNVSFTIN